MLKWFICPDGERCEVSSCLSKCRIGRRCNPPSVLSIKAEQREYPNDLAEYVPSVTELLGEPYQKMLEIKHDFAEPPYASNWKVRGTAMHARIEAQNILGVLSEQRYPMVIDGVIISQGQYDAIDVTEGTIWDYKSFGNWQVGHKLSKPFIEGFEKEIWQLNAYRYIINDRLPSLAVDRMALYVNVPDVSKTRYEEALENWKSGRVRTRGENKGLPYPEPIHLEYTFDIPVYNKGVVKDKFLKLRDRWDKCIETDGESENYRCSDRWHDDTKCKSWCSVKEFCPYFRETYG